MREIVLFLFCVILNEVKAPAPFKLPKTNLPQSKPPTTTTKLPKWNDYISKNSGSKPMKDNAYLATLVMKPPNPKENLKQNTEIKKVEVNKTNAFVNEKECANCTKVLFAKEIVPSPILLTGKEAKEKESRETPNNLLLPIIKLDEKGFKEANLATGIKRENVTMKMNTTEPKKGMKLHELFKPLQIKPKVNTNDTQKPFAIPPTMIPIFRPNPNLARNQAAKENIDIIPTPKPVVTPVQESPAPGETSTPKEAKSSLYPNPNTIAFNIPCHRASDVLDEVTVKPDSVLQATQAKLEPIPKSISPISQEQNQVERPEKLEADESVAVIFKPKNISLLNVYGDLLKKITLTVLVPYHISKLGT